MGSYALKRLQAWDAGRKAKEHRTDTSADNRLNMQYMRELAEAEKMTGDIPSTQEIWDAHRQTVSQWRSDAQKQEIQRRKEAAAHGDAALPSGNQIKADTARRQLEMYLASDERKEWARRQQENLQAQALLEGITDGQWQPEIDRREQALRDMADYWQSQVDMEHNRDITARNLETIDAMNEEDRAAFEKYVRGDTYADEKAFDAVGFDMDAIERYRGLKSRYGDQLERLKETWVRQQDAERNRQAAEKTAAMLDSNMDRALAWIPSVAAQIIGGVTGSAARINEMFNGTGQYKGFAETTRGDWLSTIGKTVQEETGKAILGGEELNLLDGISGREVGALAYQGATSLLNIAGRIALSFGSAGIGAGLAATQTFADSMSEASKQGASAEQAVILSVGKAGLEAATEKLPLDDLLDIARQGGKGFWTALKQAVTEITEEELSLFGGIAMEAAVLREKSSYKQNIGDMVAAGVPYKKAKEQADRAVWNEALQTAVVSGFSGAASAKAANYYNSVTGSSQSSSAEAQPPATKAQPPSAQAERAEILTPETQPEATAQAVPAAPEAARPEQAQMEQLLEGIWEEPKEQRNPDQLDEAMQDMFKNGQKETASSLSGDAKAPRVTPDNATKIDTVPKISVQENGTEVNGNPAASSDYYDEFEDWGSNADREGVENPMADRNYSEVGKRSVKAYMYENPAVKPFYQEQAAWMLSELADTTRGERTFNEQVHYDSGGEQGWSGTKRHTSESIAELLDQDGMTYDQIEQGLNAIINDNGQENNAVSKRIEFVINDRLMNGYRDFFTGKNVPGNVEYLALLREQQSASAADTQMGANDQSPESGQIRRAEAPANNQRGSQNVVGKLTFNYLRVAPQNSYMSNDGNGNYTMYDDGTIEPGDRIVGGMNEMNGWRDSGLFALFDPIVDGKVLNANSDLPRGYFIVAEIVKRPVIKRVASTYKVAEKGRIIMSREGAEKTPDGSVFKANAVIRDFQKTDGYQAMSREDRIRSINEIMDHYTKIVDETAPGIAIEANAVPADTKAVSNPIESYPSEKQKTIRSFLQSVDENLKSFVKQVKNGDLTFRRLKLSNVSDRAVSDIKALIGIDVSGYTNNINTNGIKHTLNRHGENGSEGGQDTTMELDDDIARIGWVLENYDSVEPMTEKGKQVYSSEFMDKDNKPAPQLRFIKKIDGTYYVVEAVCENKYKKLWVQSAYLQKNKGDVTQAPAEDLSANHETNARSALASPSPDSSLPENGAKVNGNIDESSTQDADIQEQSPEGGQIKGTGAAERNFSGKAAYQDLLTDENTQPDRPGDVRPMEIPKTDGNGKHVTEFAANAYGAGVTTDEMANTIESLIQDGELGFNVRTNRESLNNAAAGIKKRGTAATRKQLTNRIDHGKIQDGDIEQGILLYARYAEQGDDDNASEMLVDLAQMANITGRNLQMFKLLRRMTPEGQLMTVQKEVGRTVDKMIKAGDVKKGYVPSIDPELERAYIEAAREVKRLSEERSDTAERRIELADEYLEEATAEARNAEKEADRLERRADKREQAALRAIDEAPDRLETAKSRQDTAERRIEEANQRKAEVDKKIRKAERAAGSKEKQARRREEALRNAEKRLEEIQNAIYAAEAAKMPATFKAKWDAWRYMAMLGNAKTQIRNVAGNIMFEPYKATKDKMAALFEKALPQDQRTKALIQDPGLLKWARADAKSADVQDALKYTAKLGDDATSQKIAEQKKVFDSKALEGLRRLTAKAPQAGDMLFKNDYYARSLAGFLKARGYSAQQIQNGAVSADVMAEARSYAIDEAMKATFNDSNAFSDAIASIGRRDSDNPWVKALSAATEGILPFRRTPANILVRFSEYSPAGLAKGMWNMATHVRNGDLSAAAAIDQITAGLTGTGMMTLGYMMAAGMNGIKLTGSGTEEDEKRQGHQDYALEFSINGKEYSYRIDWAAPANLPLFVGANIYNAMQKSGADPDVSKFTSILRGMGTAFEPMLALSCMSSLNDLVESTRYAEEGEALYTIAANMATSYFTQGIPALARQAYQASQQNKQTTFANDPDPTIRDLQKTAAQIPFLGDQFQTEKRNAWGETEEQGSGTKSLLDSFLPWETSAETSRVIDAFFNPGSVKEIDNSELETEISRLNEAQTESVTPPTAAKTLSYTDRQGEPHKDVRLTEEQYQTLAQTQGQTAKRILDSMIGSKDYSVMTDSQKAAARREVYSYARKTGEIAAIGDDHTGYEDAWMMELQEGKEADQILRRVVSGDLSGAMDALDTAWDKGYDEQPRSDEMKWAYDTFMSLTPEAKEDVREQATGTTAKYIEAREKGVSHTAFVSAAESIAKAKGTGSNGSVRDIDRREAIASTRGLSEKSIDTIMKCYMEDYDPENGQTATTELKYDYIRQELGLSPKQYTQTYRAHLDNSKKADKIAAMMELGYDRNTATALYDIYAGNSKGKDMYMSLYED